MAALLLVMACGAEPIDWTRPTLGIVSVSVADIAPLLVEKKISIPVRSGCVVCGVSKYGPANDKLALLDVITRIDETDIDGPESLADAMRDKTSPRLFIHRREKRGNRELWRRTSVIIAPVRYDSFLDASLEQRFDEVERRTIVRHKDEPPLGAKTCCQLYFIIKDGSPEPLRLRMQYRGRDFISALRFSVRDGDQLFELKADVFVDWHLDNAGSDCIEWCDLPAPDDIAAALTRPGTIVRFHGRDYIRDHEPDFDERARIQHVIDGWRMRAAK